MKTNKVLSWLQNLGYIKMTALIMVILYAVGTAAHLYRPTLGLMMAMTPWFLLSCGVAVIWPSIRTGGKRFLLWGAAVYAVTFFLEALGVATGLVFGEYHYGRTLGLAVFGVPVVIAFNWAVVVYGAVRMVERRKRPDLMTAVMTGAVATMFDWIMEPVAIRLDYWTWTGGDIPLQNYLAWFVIAAVPAYAYRKLVSAGRLAGAAVGSTGRTDAVPAGNSLADGDLADGAGTLAGFYVLVQAGFFAALRAGWALGF
jgi:putative membrane protein